MFGSDSTYDYKVLVEGEHPCIESDFIMDILMDGDDIWLQNIVGAWNIDNMDDRHPNDDIE